MLGYYSLVLIFSYGNFCGDLVVTDELSRGFLSMQKLPIYRLYIQPIREKIRIWTWWKIYLSDFAASTVSFMYTSDGNIWKWRSQNIDKGQSISTCNLMTCLIISWRIEQFTEMDHVANLWTREIKARKIDVIASCVYICFNTMTTYKSSNRLIKARTVDGRVSYVYIGFPYTSYRFLLNMHAYILFFNYFVVCTQSTYIYIDK